MTKTKMLAAAAVLASALASPAMAQQVIYNPGYCAQFYPNANCQNRGPGSPYDPGYYQDQAYRDGVRLRRRQVADASSARLQGRERGRPSRSRQRPSRSDAIGGG